MPTKKKASGKKRTKAAEENKYEEEGEEGEEEGSRRPSRWKQPPTPSHESHVNLPSSLQHGGSADPWLENKLQTGR